VTEPALVIDLLTPDEAQLLAELETTVDRGLATFIDVARALSEIRDRRLYRATHESFDAYCAERHGFTRQRAHQLIRALPVVEAAAGAGLVLTSERKARLLAGLSDDDIVTVARFVRATAQTHDPSAAEVQAVAETVRLLNQTATVAHPETGEPTPWTTLPHEHRGVVLAAAVTTGTHDRLVNEQATIAYGRPSTTPPSGTGETVSIWDWLDDYRRNNLTTDQDLVIRINRTGYHILLEDTSTGEAMHGVQGQWMRQALMRFREELE